MTMVSAAAAASGDAAGGGSSAAKERPRPVTCRRTARSAATPGRTNRPRLSVLVAVVPSAAATRIPASGMLCGPTTRPVTARSPTTSTRGSARTSGVATPARATCTGSSNSSPSAGRSPRSRHSVGGTCSAAR